MTELARTWGNNIKQMRLIRGMSPDVFAEELGVSAATVSRWENGKMIPRDENKVEIATVLDVDVRALFPLTRPVVGV